MFRVQDAKLVTSLSLDGWSVVVVICCPSKIFHEGHLQSSVGNVPFRGFGHIADHSLVLMLQAFFYALHHPLGPFSYPFCYTADALWHSHHFSTLQILLNTLQAHG